MKKKNFFLIRMAVTIIVLLAVLSAYFYVIKPKYVYGDGFPTTSTFKGFYESKRNSYDLLFLGSSHGVCAFNPKVMDEYDISSYNLSCEQQNLFTSYYWLKEALKYQKPQTVVLDVYMLYLFDADSMKPTTANCTRKGFDFMRLSPNKISACINAKKVDKELSLTSMLFPNVMYHTRWKELSSKDFRINFSDDPNFLRGFYPLEGQGVEGFVPIDVDYEDETVNPNPLMLEYLFKIMKLCDEKGIKLVLVSTPTGFETNSQHLTMWSLASFFGNDVDFIDFNTKQVYEECGYDFSKDNNDDDHANKYGARKITEYIAKELKSQP